MAKKSTDGTTRIMFRTTPEAKEFLQEWAARDHRNVSQLVSVLIDAAIEKESKRLIKENQKTGGQAA